MRYRIGVDICGTFTDLACFDRESNTFSVVKIPTDIKNPVRSVIRAIEYADIDLNDVETIIHATTLGTNIFLGQKGLKKPKLDLITTKGFRDVIKIGRHRRLFSALGTFRN